MSYESSHEQAQRRHGATLLGVAAAAVVGVFYVAITVPTLQPLEEPHQVVEAGTASVPVRVAPLDAGVDWSRVPVAEDAPSMSVAAYGP